MSMRAETYVVYGIFFTNREMKEKGFEKDSYTFDQQVEDVCVTLNAKRSPSYEIHGHYGMDYAGGDEYEGYVLGVRIENIPVPQTSQIGGYKVKPLKQDVDDVVKSRISKQTLIKIQEVLKTDKEPELCLVHNFS